MAKTSPKKPAPLVSMRFRYGKRTSQESSLFVADNDVIILDMAARKGGTSYIRSFYFVIDAGSMGDGIRLLRKD